MKLPNGYGSVYKLSGKRRKPWVARKTIGYDERAYPVYEYLGYYATRAEALSRLAQAPQSDSTPTLEEIYQSYLKRVVSRRKESYSRVVESRWNNHLKKYARKRLSEIDLRFVQSVIDGIEAETQKPHVNGLIHSLLSEAVKNGCLPAGSENVTKYVETGDHKAKQKEVYTEDEIKSLWEHTDDLYVRIVLFLIYSGMRISEFCGMESHDGQFVEVTEAKTKAGIRTVPIHDRIYPYIDEMCALAITPQSFRNNYRKHLPGRVLTAHECRHTFITRLVEAGVDSRMVKTIVGHAGGNVTDDVYTHISREALLKEVNKLA